MPGRLKVATDALESSATGVQRVRHVFEEVRVDSVIRGLIDALPGGSLAADHDLLESRWSNEVAAELYELDNVAGSMTHAAATYAAAEARVSAWLRWTSS